MTRKQKKSIKLVSWMSEEYNVDKNRPMFKTNFMRSLGIESVEESREGKSPEEAFILKTNKGITVEFVNNIEKFVKLLLGHKRLALQTKMWEEDIKNGQLFYSDFEDEIDVVKNYVRKLFLRIFPQHWELI